MIAPSRTSASSRRPGSAHQRLSRELRERLQRGDFADGQRLPTEAELEVEYGVSRQTVRRAFLDLVAEGLVRRIPGRGTFATDTAGASRYARTVGSLDDLMEWNDSTLEVVEPMALRSDRNVADLLELDSPVVATIRYHRIFADQVFGATSVHVPPEIGRLLLEGRLLDDARTVIRGVDQCLDGAVAGVQQTLNAAAADKQNATSLGLPVGSPVLRAERIFFDTDTRPVEIAVTHYHPERYSYRLEIRGRLSADLESET